MSTKDTDIARATERLAEALKCIEASRVYVKYLYYKNPDRDCGLLYQLDDASAQLGYALATLVGWVDDEVEGTDE